MARMVPEVTDNEVLLLKATRKTASTLSHFCTLYVQSWCRWMVSFDQKSRWHHFPSLWVMVRFKLTMQCQKVGHPYFCKVVFFFYWNSLLLKIFMGDPYFWRVHTIFSLLLQISRRDCSWERPNMTNEANVQAHIFILSNWPLYRAVFLF